MEKNRYHNMPEEKKQKLKEYQKESYQQEININKKAKNSQSSNQYILWI